MRCNPWRWLWGLIPIIMLSWVAFHLQGPVIEDDLTSRAQRTLDEAGYNWAQARFSGRDAVVSGLAPDDSTPRKAIQAVRSIWGVRLVRAETDLIDRVSNYTWTASVRDGRMTVSGFVPNSDTRQSVMRLIKSNFPNAEIDDDMRLARGGPQVAQWVARIGFALRQLRYLSRGRADLSADEVRLSGEAVDFTSYKTLASHLAGTLPGGLIRAVNLVTPPEVDPFRWKAVLTPQQVVLDGYVPKEQLRELLFRRAKAAFPNLAIVDRMQTAGGAPRNWQRVVTLALSQLARLSRGETELIRRDLSFIGETTTEARAQEIAGELKRGIPETYKLVENITYPKPVYPVSSPYVTTVELQDGEISLTGSAPNPEARQWLVGSVRKLFPNAQWDDQIQLASGQTEGWRPCLSSGLQGLAKFSSGRVQLVGRRLELKAATRDEKLFKSVPAELRAAANRACDTEALIDLQLPMEPDLTWRAVRGEKEIVLEGEVPDAESKLQLVDAAGSLFSGAKLVDRMEVVKSPSGNWVKVAGLGLKLLASLRSGEAVLHDRNLLIRGEVADTATATSIKSRLDRDIAKGYQGRDRIVVRSNAMIWAEREAERRRLEAQKLADEESQKLAAAEEARRRAEEEARRQQAAAEEAERRRQDAAEALRRRREQEQTRRAEAESKAKQCEEKLTSAATEGIILFDVARATLKSQSRPTLDRLAQLVRGCDTGIVEISGHTDSDGSDDLNLELSQQRAETVMRYLNGAGVETNRMRAIGYGESKPVVPNTTSDNKAKNRRIEFKVMIE